MVRLLFEDLSSSIKNNKPTFSNGAVYADFDNDGDLDIAVNNIDEDAMIYENKTNNKGQKDYLELKLKANRKN